MFQIVRKAIWRQVNSDRFSGILQGETGFIIYVSEAT